MLIHFLHRIVANPWVYDGVQYLLGFEQACRRLAPYLGQTDSQTVLDVDAGTGNYAGLVPRSAKFFWLHNDPVKLRRFKAKWSSRLGAMLGNATRICLKDKSVDSAVCIALAHHLSDEELPSLFSEPARVVRQRLIFLDAVERKGSKISNPLWKFDRGSQLRSAQALCSAMDQWFVTRTNGVLHGISPLLAMRSKTEVREIDFLRRLLPYRGDPCHIPYLIVSRPSKGVLTRTLPLRSRPMIWRL